MYDDDTIDAFTQRLADAMERHPNMIDDMITRIDILMSTARDNEWEQSRR
jgi:hypothetical protein